MYFAGKCYLFDLLSVNPFINGLDEVMASKTIVKIFHDFCEDQSALINQYNLNCYFVFDTQIAHRVVQQALCNTSKLLNYKDNNISLADLLKNYIDVVHTKKHEISAKMRHDDMFWERRPLT
jgi:ribonuclease D